METRDRFTRFMKVILEHEGGLSDNKKDPGGITNYGISLRYLRSMGQLGDIDGDGDVDADDIRALNPQKVYPFYLKSFYIPTKADQIPYSELALQVFDFAVNAGVSRSVKTLQRILKVNDDGVIGAVTLATIKQCNLCELSQRFLDSRIEFYEDLVIQKPDLKGFLNGWKARALHCISALS